MKKLLFTIILCCGIAQMQAQTTALAQFSGFQQGSSVQLLITISGGNTCQGIEIERAEDSIHFYAVGSIAGICGSNEKDESYTFTDYSPLQNQKNYYRLLLGQLGYSPVTVVSFFNFEDGMLLFPNPAIENTILYFPNESNETLEINLYDAAGRLAFTTSTRNSSVTIQTGNYDGGLYHVIIRQNGSILFRTKFIIL